MSETRLRILVVSRMFPFPPKRGERKRVYYLMRELMRRHEVTLISRLLDENDRAAVPEAEKLCDRVLTAFVPPPRGPLDAAVRLARPLLHGEPLRVGTLCFPIIGDLICRELSKRDYDVVILHHTPLTHYLRYIPPGFRGIKVANLHNIETMLLERMSESSSSVARRWMTKIDARLMRRYEPRALAAYDHIFTVSDIERRVVERWLPHAQVTTIENGVDAEEVDDASVAQPHRAGPELLYIGSMRYGPNEEAVRWFCSRVLPQVQSAIPDVRFTVVGPDVPHPLRRWASDAVQFAGEVPEVRPYYEKAALVVVPLQAGGGTRHKILEAMNYGVPIVTTSLGAEGILLDSGVHALLADEPEEFTRQVIRLLQEPEQRFRIAQAARAHVRAHFDWRAIGERLNEALLGTHQALTGRP